MYLLFCFCATIIVEVFKLKKGQTKRNWTKEQKLAIMKHRLATLRGTDKNVKCPGVTRKLARQIRSMENE